MRLRKAYAEECERLTQMSIVAFHTDPEVGGEPDDGPPDYDSFPWHEQMYKEGNLYTYLDEEGTAVGGAVLQVRKDCLFVERIFVDPQYMRKGYGYSLMKDIEEMFSSINIFRLDTPLVNRRTNALYQKLGYCEIGRTIDTISYEKRKEI